MKNCLNANNFELLKSFLLEDDSKSKKRITLEMKEQESSMEFSENSKLELIIIHTEAQNTKNYKYIFGKSKKNNKFDIWAVQKTTPIKLKIELMKNLSLIIDEIKHSKEFLTMNKLTEQKLNFETGRLSVNHWKTSTVADKLSEKVIEILSPNVTKALPDGWQNISALDKAEAWIKSRDEESYFLIVKLLSTNEIIGFIFLYEADNHNNQYNLRFGYLLAESSWGKGLGTELINGLVNWCKESGDIKSLSGGVEANNKGSIRVLEKAGFSALVEDNSNHDTIFYEYIFI